MATGALTDVKLRLPSRSIERRGRNDIAGGTTAVGGKGPTLPRIVRPHRPLRGGDVGVDGHVKSTFEHSHSAMKYEEGQSKKG